jgi:hypothetical protein
VSALTLSASSIRTAALVAAVLVAGWEESAEAQVGLASRESRVALIAQVPAAASLQRVGSFRVLEERNSLREAAVTIRVASTAGYRLLVHRTGQAVSGQAARVWVLAVDRRFHELREGSPVTVAQYRTPTGELEREIVYRFETHEPTSETDTLPVRYELAVTPIM